MFTGIVTDVGRVRSVSKTPGGRRLAIETGFEMGGVPIGASIACSGCCLTVIAKADHVFEVDVSPETLDKTTLGGWEVGTRVNLERSLQMGDELGGHIVSGHVDGVAECLSVVEDGESWRMAVRVPEPLARFIAPKGSVALEGVSLTVNEVSGAEFGVCLIPHTWNHTNFQNVKSGGRLNLEVDLLARYVNRILEAR